MGASHHSVATGRARAATRRGGTLRLLMGTHAIASLDQARDFRPGALVVSPAFIRRLTLYGKDGDLLPDLAADTGRPSAGGRSWSFRLRPGITYEDGTPVRAADIRHNIERSFAAGLDDGVPFHRPWLRGAAGYQGPYGPAAAHLDGVETPDDLTITFHLTRPVNDFNYVTAWPLFSPVPETRDGSERYGDRPLATGPYRIETYQPGRQLSLTRNPRWDPATDPLRPAYPDRIVAELYADPAEIDERLIADTGEDRHAVAVATTVQPQNVARVLGDPALRARTYSKDVAQGYYLAIDTTAALFRDPAVRRAFQYAIDRRAAVDALGGPEAGGEVATSVLPPALTGGRRPDVYRAPPEGDSAAAQQLLTDADFPAGAELTLAHAERWDSTAVARVVERSLRRAGLRPRLQPLSVDGLHRILTAGGQRPPLVLFSWAAAWLSPSAFLPPILNGRSGSSNYARYDDPAVNARFDELAGRSREEALAGYSELDQHIMRDSPVVPLVWARKLYLRGSDVHGQALVGGRGLYFAADLFVTHH